MERKSQRSTFKRKGWACPFFFARTPAYCHTVSFIKDQAISLQLELDVGGIEPLASAIVIAEVPDSVENNNVEHAHGT